MLKIKISRNSVNLVWVRLHLTKRWFEYIIYHLFLFHLIIVYTKIKWFLASQTPAPSHMSFSVNPHNEWFNFPPEHFYMILKKALKSKWYSEFGNTNMYRNVIMLVTFLQSICICCVNWTYCWIAHILQKVHDH